MIKHTKDNYSIYRKALVDFMIFQLFLYCYVSADKIQFQTTIYFNANASTLSKRLCFLGKSTEKLAPT